MTPLTSTGAATGAGLPPGNAGPVHVRGPGLAMTVGSVLAVMIGAVLFVGGLIVIAAVLLAAFVVTLCVVAVRGAAHALHPHGSGRVDHRASHPSVLIDGVLIDTTATVRPVSAPNHPRTPDQNA